MDKYTGSTSSSQALLIVFFKMRGLPQPSFGFLYTTPGDLGKPLLRVFFLKRAKYKDKTFNDQGCNKKQKPNIHCNRK